MFRQRQAGLQYANRDAGADETLFTAECLNLARPARCGKPNLRHRCLGAGAKAGASRLEW